MTAIYPHYDWKSPVCDVTSANCGPRFRHHYSCQWNSPGRNISKTSRSLITAFTHCYITTISTSFDRVTLCLQSNEILNMLLNRKHILCTVRRLLLLRSYALGRVSGNLRLKRNIFILQHIFIMTVIYLKTRFQTKHVALNCRSHGGTTNNTFQYLII
jgi:hypothetical protein